jgi:hypothetical protein
MNPNILALSKSNFWENKARKANLINILKTEYLKLKLSLILEEETDPFCISEL